MLDDKQTLSGTCSARFMTDTGDAEAALSRPNQSPDLSIEEIQACLNSLQAKSIRFPHVFLRLKHNGRSSMNWHAKARQLSAKLGELQYLNESY